MIAIVSHDIRNPLTAIRTTAGLLAKLSQQQGLDPSFFRLIGYIDKSVNRVYQLTSDLLDLSKMEAGHLKIKLKNEKVSDLFAEALDLFRPIASEREITLTASQLDNYTVYCAKERIHQVLSNLISNALKFTPAKGTIRLYANDKDDEINITVEDSGAGIATSDLPHIFTRFWQGKSSFSRGVGLGLSIVKAMVELHGGKVSVVSEKGNGSRFMFTLPKHPPQ
jgi:signal transduction histidine kinase